MDFAPLQYRILVVDDQEQICKMIKMVLEKMGYRTDTALNGTDAMALFQKETFHLVITDLNMPEMDGASLAFSIKEQVPGIPVFIMTGNADESVKEIPADTVFRKPFDMNAFKSEVAKHLPAL